jgi:hypothetical protein
MLGIRFFATKALGGGVAVAIGKRFLRIAYNLADVPGLSIRDLGSGVSCLEDFLAISGLSEWPAIQLSI